MWSLGTWLSLGLVTVLAGAFCLHPDLDSAALEVLGYVLIAAGGLITQVTVIGIGVLVGLREHARSSG